MSKEDLLASFTGICAAGKPTMGGAGGVELEVWEVARLIISSCELTIVLVVPVSMTISADRLAHNPVSTHDNNFYYDGTSDLDLAERLYNIYILSY